MADKNTFEQCLGLGTRVLKGGGKISFPPASSFRSEYNPNKLQLGLHGISRGNWKSEAFQPGYVALPGGMVVANERHGFDFVPLTSPGPAVLMIAELETDTIGENELAVPLIRTAMAQLAPQVLMGVLPVRGKDRFVITTLDDPDTDLPRFMMSMIQLAGTPVSAEGYAQLMQRYQDKGWLYGASLCFGAVTPGERFDPENNFLVISTPE
jgi:hypothetical protein